MGPRSFLPLSRRDEGVDSRKVATSRLDVIDLPMGFFPEGIARGGEDWTAYVGSLNDGSIWKGDLYTGVGEIVVTGQGDTSVGLAYDPRSGYLFVAGGTSGARIYNDRFGLVADYAFAGEGESSFVNDVIITDTSAYFTDSRQARLYSVSLNSVGGGLADGSDHPGNVIHLSSEFPNVEGQFNANGIEANDDGSTLIVSNKYAGILFTVDPTTGNATAIDLGGDFVYGDGLVLRQNTLWAIENGSDGGPQQIKQVTLSADLSCGAVIPRVLTNELFNNPTTAARKGHSFYVVNAKFGVPEEDRSTTAYEIVRVDRDSGEYNCSAL
eukprot:jgi/Undpi1/268/HiC_scaffold_1.g00264.m1